MELKDIVSVAGIGGLKRILARRNDGIIVSELDGSGKKFLSSRIHMFTPLENIAIYTQTDSEPLAGVLWKMKQQDAAGNAPVSPAADADALKAYMAQVLPEYDRDQVYVSDIKKLIKWYAILDPLGLIADPEAEKPGDQEEAGTGEGGSE